MRALGERQQRCIRLGAHHVEGDLRHRGLVERSEDDLAAPSRISWALGAHHTGATLIGANRDQLMRDGAASIVLGPLDEAAVARRKE